MFGARTLARHAHLVHSMATTVGADLPRALADGWLTGEGLREAVLRCTGCAAPGACIRWLGDHAGGAEAAPGFCENGVLFTKLRADGG
jgi:hypothetical protein